VAHAKQKPKIFPKNCTVVVLVLCVLRNVFIFGITFLFVVMGFEEAEEVFCFFFYCLP